MTPKTIHLYDSYHFLRRCAGLLLEDGRFVKPNLMELSEGGCEPLNEWLYLCWDEINEEYGGIDQIWLAFTEGDNERIVVDGSVLVLKDIQGDEIRLTLLQEWVPLVK